MFADEAESFGDRIRLGKKNGVEAVEFWKWTNKDLDEIDAALKETGVELGSFVAEPMISLTDSANRDAFLCGLERSIQVAKQPGANTLIAQAGDTLPHTPRDMQRNALVTTLRLAGGVLAGTGVRLGVEPLNTRIDHIGYFLPSTREALETVKQTGRDEIGIIYDIYHSAVMDEETAKVIGNDMDRVLHVHIADHPGRNEPGSGSINLSDRLKWLFEHSYDSAVILEYKPVKSSSSTIVQFRILRQATTK
jgi:hydroxypyruvate isomerase